MRMGKRYMKKNIANSNLKINSNKIKFHNINYNNIYLISELITIDKINRDLS